MNHRSGSFPTSSHCLVATASRSQTSAARRRWSTISKWPHAGFFKVLAPIMTLTGRRNLLATADALKDFLER